MGNQEKFEDSDIYSLASEKSSEKNVSASTESQKSDFPETNPINSIRSDDPVDSVCLNNQARLNNADKSNCANGSNIANEPNVANKPVHSNVPTQPDSLICLAYSDNSALSERSEFIENPNRSDEQKSSDSVSSLNKLEQRPERSSGNVSATISDDLSDKKALKEEYSKQELSEDIYSLKESPESFSDVSLPKSPPQFSGEKKKSERESFSYSKHSDLEKESKFQTAPSLDDLYERRRRAREAKEIAGEDPDRLLIPERPQLPDKPFWTHLFRPLLSPRFLVRVLVIVSMGLIPFYLAMQYYIHLQFGEIESTKTLNVFFRAIWGDRVILFLFSFLWGILSIPNSFYVFEATANGDDQLEEGPEFSFIGGFGQFAWFGIIILLSGLPWYFLFSPLGFGDFSFLIGVIFLFPVFFLSCMETDSLFALLSKNVYRSFKKIKGFWIKFYFFSVILVAFSLFAATVLLLAVAKNTDSFWFVLFASVFATFLFSITPMFYLRVLGRLAWIIQEMEPDEK
ncbi:MAG: hypothetical protein Q4C95_05040 [Planctomycetia bacterium]|nr:hypothetical protein [Planctomycetia bacterium]